jgi:hypothetical protein
MVFLPKSGLERGRGLVLFLKAAHNLLRAGRSGSWLGLGSECLGWHEQTTKETHLDEAPFRNSV